MFEQEANTYCMYICTWVIINTFYLPSAHIDTKLHKFLAQHTKAGGQPLCATKKVSKKEKKQK